jgi:uncharacterized protein (TIRG00374 family)
MKLVKNTALLLIGCLMLWLALRNLPFIQLKNTLQNANYWLLFPVFAITALGYVWRIKRWQLLYENLLLKINFRTAWIALSACYLVSYAIPRGGEITRCLLIQRYHRIPFHQSLATIIVERLVDTLVLLLLIMLIVLVNVEQTAQFFILNIINPIISKLSFSHIIIGLVLLITIGLIAILFYKRSKQKVTTGWTIEFMEAMKQMLKLKSKFMFALYTTLIWLGYFLMTYIWIFAFPESSHLPASQVFTIMIIGTIGKSIPIQGGGMGAYHYLVAQAFLLFGVGLVTGNALAIIIHGAQTVYTIITGGSAYLMLMFDEKKRNL